MKKKMRVAVLFGGKSAEHEVSIQSAKNVIGSLDKNKYEIIPIKLEKEGTWNTDLKNIDVVFPVLHGPFGEDGSIQGLLKLLNIPYVGSGILGSAVGMDKDVMKRLLRDGGLPIGKFITFRTEDNINFSDVKKKLGLPFFVKPANMGSSIGVNKVFDKKSFDQAITDAFLYDTKIVIEEFIKGKEVECAILGNDKPIASVLGEIVATHEFYDYEAKYFDENGALLKIPAAIPNKKVLEIQKLAIKTFETLSLSGMARIDFFFSNDEKIYVNEANTIPGFTNISMYPKLWEATGISYEELVDRLIQHAIERFEEQKKLKTTV